MTEAPKTTSEPAGVFTPGPWFVGERQSYFCVYARGGQVARTAYGLRSTVVPQQLASARLIAAAPDLLQAVRLCEATLRAVDNSAIQYEDEALWASVSAARSDARAAIAKATGAAT